MTPAELAAIRERANNATKGPWTAEGNPNAESCVSSAEGICIGGYDAQYPPTDAVFIAHARTDIPALLDHVDSVAESASAFAQAVSSLTADNVRLGDILQAIRKLHTSVKPDSDGEHYLDPLTRKPKCGECLLIYPCPTVKALDGD